ncbi:HNH endonuclease (plasmid) [Legionella pneumophila]|nr:HNH endonuclease [Legionella pneumophila]CZL44862.1 Uncharacterised protein [Legionella pneumophila]
MSYSMNIEVNEFPFQFGRMAYQTPSIGIFIDFSNVKIKEAIETGNENFYNAIKSVLSQGDEIDALYEMTNFEHYALQGHGWRALTEYYDFASLEKFKFQAELVLASKHANEEQLRVARTIIDVLNGTYKFPPPPERSPEEKAKAAFERKKPKLKLKLTIDRGYKCDQCGNSTENSLCLIRRDNSILNYEIDNLVLRCRKCMNKMRSKQ